MNNRRLLIVLLLNMVFCIKGMRNNSALTLSPVRGITAQPAYYYQEATLPSLGTILLAERAQSEEELVYKQMMRDQKQKEAEALARQQYEDHYQARYREQQIQRRQQQERHEIRRINSSNKNPYITELKGVLKPSHFKKNKASSSFKPPIKGPIEKTFYYSPEKNTLSSLDQVRVVTNVMAPQVMHTKLPNTAPIQAKFYYSPEGQDLRLLQVKLAKKDRK